MQRGGLMGASMKISGMEAIDHKLNAYSKKMQLIERTAIRAGAEILADKIREEVPVSDIDHLHIRDDIMISNVKRQDKIPFVEVGPSKKTAWRARFLEYGTIKMSPNPFMSRAEKLSRDAVSDVIKSVIRKGLNL
jgi:HK97 gp10 family phage protein